MAILKFRLPWGKRYALVVARVLAPALVQVLSIQPMMTVVSGLEEAFAYFGGVPTACEMTCAIAHGRQMISGTAPIVRH